MFREMMRTKQNLSKTDAEAMLKKATWGVLSLASPEGYPYGVPVNFSYDKDVIYFHGALKGHKMDCILKNPKASFTVVLEDDILEADYTTAYSSVICFGTIDILKGEERQEALIHMTDRLAPSVSHEVNTHVAKHCEKAAVFSMKIEHMTAKVGIKKLED